MKADLVLAAALTFAVLAAPVARGADDVRNSNGIAYVSGGVGLESRRALRESKDNYNLMVTLARADGHYMGGAALSIRDARGKAVLTIDTEGPWTFAKLPPGTYTVEATIADITRRAEVSVRAKQLKRVRLSWNRRSTKTPE